MVIALLTMVLVTMAGMALMAQSRTETQIAANDMWSAQALYSAEAGYAEVLVRMSDPGDTDNYMGQAEGAWTAEPGWGRYVVVNAGASTEDPNFTATTKDGLDNDGDSLVDEAGECYPEILSIQTDQPIDYAWVKCHYLRNQANNVVLFGDHDGDPATPPEYNTAQGFPVIVITAQGAEGPARRTIEIEAVKPPIEMMQSALYAESDNFKFNGNSFKVSGMDWDPVLDQPIVGASEVAGILTTGTPEDIKDDLNNNQEANVEGLGLEPSVLSASTDVDLEALAEQYRSQAQMTFPGGTYSNVTWGDYNNYTVVHVQGDLHGSAQGVGGGVLVVDGDFVCTGQWTWYGIVLVMGRIDFSGGGSGKHLYGATLIAGAGQQTIGGNADILYSSAALQKLSVDTPYKVVNWRELDGSSADRTTAREM
jgi:hypothetical protein